MRLVANEHLNDFKRAIEKEIVARVRRRGMIASEFSWENEPNLSDHQVHFVIGGRRLTLQLSDREVRRELNPSRMRIIRNRINSVLMDAPQIEPAEKGEV